MFLDEVVLSAHGPTVLINLDGSESLSSAAQPSRHRSTLEYIGKMALVEVVVVEELNVLLVLIGQLVTEFWDKEEGRVAPSQYQVPTRIIIWGLMNNYRTHSSIHTVMSRLCKVSSYIPIVLGDTQEAPEVTSRWCATKTGL